MFSTVDRTIKRTHDSTYIYQYTQRAESVHVPELPRNLGGRCDRDNGEDSHDAYTMSRKAELSSRVEE